MEPMHSAADERPDEELLEAFRAGESGVYGELYERYRNFALMIARKYREGTEDAQDLVSEAFAKILDALGEGKGPKANFRAYLAQTVKNVAFTGPRRTVAVGLSEDVPVSFAGSAEEDVIRQESGETALRAFYNLPERWRSVLWMLDVEGLKPRDIADELGMTPNAVSALALRARDSLKENYLKEYSVLEPLEDCASFDAQIPALVRGKLSRRKMEKVEAHLDSCPRCSSKALSLMSVERTMHIWVAPVVLGMLPLWSSTTRSAALAGITGSQAGGAGLGTGSGVLSGQGSAFLGAAGRGIIATTPTFTAGAVLSTVGLVAAGMILPITGQHQGLDLGGRSGSPTALSPFLPGASVAYADEPTAVQKLAASQAGQRSVQSRYASTAAPKIGQQQAAGRHVNANALVDSVPAHRTANTGVSTRAAAPSADTEAAASAPAAAQPASKASAPSSGPVQSSAAQAPATRSTAAQPSVAQGTAAPAASDYAPAAATPAKAAPAAQAPAASAPVASAPTTPAPARAAQPVASQPAAVQPAAPKAAAPKPAAAAVTPVASDPVVIDPVITDPIVDDGWQMPTQVDDWQTPAAIDTDWQTPMDVDRNLGYDDTAYQYDDPAYQYDYTETTYQYTYTDNTYQYDDPVTDYTDYAAADDYVTDDYATVADDTALDDYANTDYAAASDYGQDTSYPLTNNNETSYQEFYDNYGYQY